MQTETTEKKVTLKRRREVGEREKIVERSKFRARMTDLRLRIILLSCRPVELTGDGRSSGVRGLFRFLIQSTGQVPAITVKLTAILILPRR